jgi:ankyrin repeat protein
MSQSNSPLKRLPAKPSEEHLRKQAKRLVKLHPALQLAEAQHQIAREYGCKNWADLMDVVEAMNQVADPPVRSEMKPLPKAANANDLPMVLSILESGEFTQHDLDLALARAVLRFRERREIARALLEHGANPNGQYGSDYGPIVFVTGENLDPDGLQFLIDAGADVTFPPVETKYGWQCPMSYFLGSYVRGRNVDKHRGIEILLRAGAFVPSEVTPAMMAIHRGDAKTLGRLLDEDPSLLSRRFADMPYGNMSLRGATLLHAAVEFDEFDCCVELLKRGADVNARGDVIYGSGGKTPIFHCVNNARSEITMKLIQAEANLDVADQKANTPLSYLCGSWAPASDRLVVAKLILENGSAVRRACENQVTALHSAAHHGPIEMVELLLRSGAKEWQGDKDGKKPIDYARAGVAADKAAIVELLDRPVIRDPYFKSAVRAIHAGDLTELQLLLRDHPNLVHDRAVEPDCYPTGYFSNPKLLWFVANNPILIERLPANISQICQAIITAGAGQDDLNYTLELVMTSNSARKQGQQIPLMRVLLSGGALPGDLLSVLGHGEVEPVRFLIESGIAMTAPIAAALGEIDQLPALLTAGDAQTKQAALGIAVINRQVDSARICLDAGADVNAFLPVHAHSLPVHQAAVNNDLEMLRLLVGHGATLNALDKLWNATPLGWAIHTGKREAEEFLRSIGTM